MKRTNIWYEVDGGGRINLKVSDHYSDTYGLDADDLLDAADDCAEHYHRHHDGWEASWPLTFELAASEEGPVLARFEISCELEPTFWSRPIAEQAAQEGAGT